MSQIQSGYNYNTTTNKIVTAENLNSHVGNAILLPGSVTEQQTLTDPVDTADRFVILDSSAGILVNTSLQDIFNVLPTDLIVSTITNKIDYDILVSQNDSNDFATKWIYAMDVHIGKPNDYATLPQYLSNVFQWPDSTGNLSVNSNIVNAAGASGTGSYISTLNFGYKNDRQPDNQHRGNSFYFFGHGTTFIGTDNSLTGYDNERHPVTIYGDLAVLSNSNANFNKVTLTVDGDINVSGDVSANGVNLKSILPKAIGRFDKDGIPVGNVINLVCLKTSTGHYEMTFNTPMTDSNYVVMLTCSTEWSESNSVQVADEFGPDRDENGFKIYIRSKHWSDSGSWSDQGFSVIVYDLAT